MNIVANDKAHERADQSKERANLKFDLSIVIGRVTFYGPCQSYLECKEKAGILAVLSRRTDGQHDILNVYQTANVKASARLELACHAKGEYKPTIAVYYCDDLDAQASTRLASLIWRAARRPLIKA